jgi:hypothetical protein
MWRQTDGRKESHDEANGLFSQFWERTLQSFNEIPTSHSGTHTVAVVACSLLLDGQHNSFKL